jgi:ABC-type molybdate transport system ATPase subunit
MSGEPVFYMFADNVARLAHRIITLRDGVVVADRTCAGA